MLRVFGQNLPLKRKGCCERNQFTPTERGSSLFGYIRAIKPEMKCLEYDLYRGVYCGLCRQLGKDYGQFSRFSLTYDCTLLAMLGLALTGDTGSQFRWQACIASPLKKKWIHTYHPMLSYAATVDVLLTAQKIEDGVTDSSLGKKTALLSLLPASRHIAKKAARQYPQLGEIVVQYAHSQQALEAQGCTSIDRAADPTAKALAGICRGLSQDPAVQKVLDRLGYHLGRYVYLMDALDDLEEDRTKGSYNVLLLRFPEETEEQIREYARQTINASIAQVAAAYELLDLKSYRSILNNIVYLGLQTQLRLLLQPSCPKRKELPDELTL